MQIAEQGWNLMTGMSNRTPAGLLNRSKHWVFDKKKDKAFTMTVEKEES